MRCSVVLPRDSPPHCACDTPDWWRSPPPWSLSGACYPPSRNGDRSRLNPPFISPPRTLCVSNRGLGPRTDSRKRGTTMKVYSSLTTRLTGVLLGVSAAALPAGPAVAGGGSAVLPPLMTNSTVVSTVPGNGDVNPYGMAQVRRSSGNLVAGSILISNFNNSANLQGTGTTIVQVAPNGSISQFAGLTTASLPGPCPGGLGLTTALVVLESGWVVVGSLPTTDGTSATAQAGCLIVLDNMGNAVETIYGSLVNGPWDMTAWESGHQAKLFFTNVLNGTVAGGGSVVSQGTVVRLNLMVSESAMPEISSMTVVGSGFA